MPRDDEQGDQINEDHDGILEEDIERRHDRRFHFAHIVGHTGDDIAATCFREIAHGQGEHLVVELPAQIPQHTRPDRNHVVVRQPRREALEPGHRHEEETE